MARRERAVRPREPHHGRQGTPHQRLDPHGEAPHGQGTPQEDPNGDRVPSWGPEAHRIVPHRQGEAQYTVILQGAPYPRIENLIMRRRTSMLNMGVCGRLMPYVAPRCGRSTSRSRRRRKEKPGIRGSYPPEVPKEPHTPIFETIQPHAPKTQIPGGEGCERAIFRHFGRSSRAAWTSRRRFALDLQARRGSTAPDTTTTPRTNVVDVVREFRLDLQAENRLDVQGDDGGEPGDPIQRNPLVRSYKGISSNGILLDVQAAPMIPEAPRVRGEAPSEQRNHV